MKRTGRLFDRICDRDNLRLAFYKALRGKRSRPDARQFAGQLEENLLWMAEHLRHAQFPVGSCQQFTIYDPKERLITAPCFRERVLHHAIMNVCEPVFERWLIADTYACRVGKGRLAALQRAQTYNQRFRFFLKLDIRKYFDSISHTTLLERLRGLFKDRRLLELFDAIVSSYQTAPGRGLPIGSLTSQHFANIYLGCLDRHLKETMRIPGYVRYMDDCVLWGQSSGELRRALRSCRQLLASKLQLDLKPEPYINRTAYGFDFLGCRVYKGHMVLNRRSRRRFCGKLMALEVAAAELRIPEAELQKRATALVAFTRTPGLRSWHFRRSVLERLAVGGHGDQPREPRWVLEQLGQELPVGEPQELERAGEPEPQSGLPRCLSSADAVDAASD